MKEPEYVITAINTLTGTRDEISGPMEYDQAKARLDREKESRRRQQYQPYKNLRVERRLPVQLTLQFTNP